MTEQTQSNGTKALISIDMDDVVNAGSVRKAIIDRCPMQYEIVDPRQLDGQTFQTSGPGSGWSREFDAADYTRAAIDRWVAESGANASEARAIDPDDGRAAYGTDEYDEDTGRWIGDLVWSEGSVIEIDCPDHPNQEDELVEHPRAVVEMARAALGDHAACSDRAEWVALVRRLKVMAEVYSELPDVD